MPSTSGVREATARTTTADERRATARQQALLRRDLTLAGLSLVGGLAMLALGVAHTIQPWPTRPPTVLFVAPLLLVCVALTLRRIATRTGLALGTAALAADLALGASLGTLLVYSQVIYDACLYGSARMWRILLRVGIGVSAASAIAGPILFGSWRGVQLAIPAVLILVLPVVTAISVRQYRDQAAAERARAEQTARLVELDRRQAVTAERTRMARELHDVIANHLSAAAIHATAALSVRERDPEAVEQSLKVIRENSVQGLAEMRQMIELLREGAGDDEPTRVRLAELDQLIAQARGAGLAVELKTTGEPYALPVGVDLAGYRIVQESLTNALKHGTGRADVAVAYDSGVVSLTVENPINGASAVPGAGAGLIGMRERAALLHGRFDAGHDGTRWRVHAELPTAMEELA
ncbi:histidine kinase [Phytohabitans flavus]|uniref:histidine kinase n=1 Tax=Phytohabitans flavus TaxID=1076124 RepID=A0A6F8XZ29_9ACTN|nr:histidine kinase [Phytohabitans flavus]BCB79049.1 two-component sensor histidine kinase [Phytohabitans flavus]